MILTDNPIAGRFIRRENRFKVLVEAGGKEYPAHLPNSGRLTELLIPGAETALVSRPSAGRSTPFDMVQILADGFWVSTDARLPNRLVEEALDSGGLQAFTGYRVTGREPKLGSGRLDLRLMGESGECLVECKSVTLIENGVARFPDAPTSRGARHMRELSEYVAAGGSGAVIFVIQRPDAGSFSPNSPADKAFAAALLEASDTGVEIRAYRCNSGFGWLQIADEVPVDLP